VDGEFVRALDDVENLLPKDQKLETLMAFLLNVFDCSCTQMLVYEEEKSQFDNLLKEEQDSSSLKRFSKILGITYFLRFIARLSEILHKFLPSDSDLPKNLVGTVKEFSTYVNANVDSFYTDEYFFART